MCEEVTVGETSLCSILTETKCFKCWCITCLHAYKSGKSSNAEFHHTCFLLFKEPSAVRLGSRHNALQRGVSDQKNAFKMKGSISTTKLLLSAETKPLIDFHLEKIFCQFSPQVAATLNCFFSWLSACRWLDTNQGSLWIVLPAAFENTGSNPQGSAKHNTLGTAFLRRQLNKKIHNVHSFVELGITVASFPRFFFSEDFFWDFFFSFVSLASFWEKKLVANRPCFSDKKCFFI